jgi:hypothetical protein
MTAIRAIFDGKTFVPQQPVSLPAQSEALVIVEAEDRAAQDQIDAASREDYQGGQGGQGGSDAEDDAWAGATSPQSHRAWDED